MPAKASASTHVMAADTLAKLLKSRKSDDGNEVSEKITRATFLYMDPQPPEGKFAQCKACIHWIPGGKDQCEIHDSTVDVDEDDSCGFYLPGKPSGIRPLGIVSPQESGLVSRQVRCENCCFFDPDTEPREHCDLYTQLNLILPRLFDLDRYVDHQGCCNAQTPGYRNPKVFGPVGPIKHGSEKG